MVSAALLFTLVIKRRTKKIKVFYGDHAFFELVKLDIYLNEID